MEPQSAPAAFPDLDGDMSGMGADGSLPSPPVPQDPSDYPSDTNADEPLPGVLAPQDAHDGIVGAGGDDPLPGLTALLGIKTITSGKEHVEMDMSITPQLQQIYGYLHGGATIALLESAASLGAVNRADLSKGRAFGVEVKVRHRKSGKRGTIRGVADLECFDDGRLVWKVAAYDEEGDVISDGTVTTKYVTYERLAEKEQERVAARAGARNG
ncbi:MAG: PaaI family thioesterase [Coriobacteriaceae bacterium]|jgi:1,4-dihydroxy-2-naphthoyl-CoA hydrolase|nr:PaaI family thioesterase [Coriobacteriaceae bacterium]